MNNFFKPINIIRPKYLVTLYIFIVNKIQELILYIFLMMRNRVINDSFLFHLFRLAIATEAYSQFYVLSIGKFVLQRRHPAPPIITFLSNLRVLIFRWICWEPKDTHYILFRIFNDTKRKIEAASITAQIYTLAVRSTYFSKCKLYLPIIMKKTEATK